MTNMQIAIKPQNRIIHVGFSESTKVLTFDIPGALNFVTGLTMAIQTALTQQKPKIELVEINREPNQNG